jgi:hypothetical protein
VIAAVEDEVSIAIASLFSGHGQQFQALSAKAAVFHDVFANLLNGGAAQYIGTEAANVKQTLASAMGTAASGFFQTSSTFPIANGGVEAITTTGFGVNTPLRRVVLFSEADFNKFWPDGSEAIEFKIATPILSFGGQEFVSLMSAPKWT